MKNFWSVLILVAILQALTISVMAGGNHHGQGSNIAHILAAGLIVQLLSRGGGGVGGFGGGRHAGGSDYPAYANSWMHESRLSPEATLASSTWAQRAPMDIAYSQSQYKEPLLESYNMPYYYQQPQAHSAGLW